jgi:hypothetical protein
LMSSVQPGKLRHSALAFSKSIGFPQASQRLRRR